MMQFEAFPKIGRLRRDIVITEKIDGTNAQIEIVQSLAPEEGAIAHKSLGTEGDLSMFAGSRTRYITPEKDNFGFARWVQEHAEELWSLGPGRHYGEWWGQGIQRGYGLTEKRFSLFNTQRWNDLNPNRPACCSVVPLLGIHTFDGAAISTYVERLRTLGSVAAPGFMKPEGIVVFHAATSTMFKQTLDQDDAPKGQAQ